jgi:Ca2+-binding RTX toxin-like protein
MYGGEDHDELHGGDGNDWCYGEDGDDLIAGGNGSDQLGGGTGNDVIYFDILDFFVDSIPGAARWGFAPKLVSGPYSGHGVHNG